MKKTFNYIIVLFISLFSCLLIVNAKNELKLNYSQNERTLNVNLSSDKAFKVSKLKCVHQFFSRGDSDSYPTSKLITVYEANDFTNKYEKNISVSGWLNGSWHCSGIIELDTTSQYKDLTIASADFELNLGAPSEPAESNCSMWNYEDGHMPLGNIGNSQAVLWCKNAGCEVKLVNNHNMCVLPTNQGGSGSGTGNRTTSKVTATTIPTTCEGVFGDFQDDLIDILKIFRILAPIIVAGFTVYEYLLAVVNKDADALKKCNSRLIKRLILMLVLFLMPSLVNLFLKLIGDNYGVCLNSK